MIDISSNICRVERVTASGGEVGRINIAGGAGVCCFSLCLFVSYQIDHSVHHFVPNPE
jgi:hypothetical protein